LKEQGDRNSITEISRKANGRKVTLTLERKRALTKKPHYTNLAEKRGSKGEPEQIKKKKE